MNGALAISVLLDVANKLHCRCAILMGQKVSAEITSRLQTNEARLRYMAERIGNRQAKLFLGNWENAHWEPWPRHLATEVMARLVRSGALEGDEAHAIWAKYLDLIEQKVSRRSP